MSSFWNFAFGIILVIAWIVAGGFLAQCSVFLAPFKDTDAFLGRAYWYTFSAAFVIWGLVALAIIGIVLILVGVFGSGAGEAGIAEKEAASVEQSAVSKLKGGAKKQGISWLTLGFLILALVLVGATGILSAISAQNINESPNFNSSGGGTGTPAPPSTKNINQNTDPNNDQLTTAYHDAIIAASLCLGAGGVLIIGITVYFIVGAVNANKAKAAEKKREEIYGKDLSGIKKLEEQSALNKAIQQTQFAEEARATAQKAVLQRLATLGTPGSISAMPLTTT